MAEMCEGVSSDSDWEFVEPLSFSLQKALDCRCEESRRDGLRRDASKSASDIQKKDDAAYATANSVFFPMDESLWQADLHASTTEYLSGGNKFLQDFLVFGLV